MNKEELGKAIKNLRKEKRVTQRELAAQTGVYYSNLAMIEKGRLNPTIDTLLKIVEGCDGEITIQHK